MRYTLDSIKALGYSTALVKCDGVVIDSAIEADDAEGWVLAHEMPLRVVGGDIAEYTISGNVTVKMRK